MRALLSRGTRPTLRPVNALGRSSTNISPRRTATPILRRQFTFCDAFTILLAPVLTTAFVIDTTRKERRRQAWDKKIAEVEAATEALRQRENEAWTRIQHRSVKLGLSHQRRLYSTATAAAIKVVDEEEVEFGEVSRGENELISDDERDMRPNFGEPSEADFRVTQYWARLIALRLALRMLLDLRFGDSSAAESTQTMILDSRHFPHATDELIEKLKQVRGVMRQISRPKIAFEWQGGASRSETRFFLDSRVEELLHAFKFRHLSLTDLVIGYANAVTATSDSPSTRTLQSLMYSLHVMGRDRMASSVAEAIWDGAQTLSDEEVTSMLNFYAKYKEVGKVDKFLKRLTRQDSFPRSKTRWKMVKLCGTNLPIPNTAQKTSFSFTLEHLVRARLRCNQRSIAEHYNILLCDNDVLSRANMSVNCAFLYHDAEYGNWHLGSKWLRKSKIDAACAVHKGLSEGKLSTVIFFMLDLCVSCNKSQEYQDILDAAVGAEIRPTSVNPSGVTRFKERTQEIRQDWEERVMASRAETQTDQQNLLEKVTHFQQLLAEKDPTLVPYVGVTDFVRLDEIKMSEGFQMRSSQPKQGRRTGLALENIEHPNRFYWKRLNLDGAVSNSSFEEPSVVTVQHRRDNKASGQLKEHLVTARKVTVNPSPRCVNSGLSAPQSQGVLAPQPQVVPASESPTVSKPESQRASSPRPQIVSAPQSQSFDEKGLETLFQDEEDEGYCSESTIERHSSPMTDHPALPSRASKPSSRVGIAIHPTDDWSEIFGTSQRQYAVG